MRQAVFLRQDAEKDDDDEAIKEYKGPIEVIKFDEKDT